MKKIVIIAAAGVGSRLGKGMPKCLVEVAGHPIIEYQLERFRWADEIRMVIGYKANEVMKRVDSLSSDVRFVVNEDYSTTTTLQSNIIGTQGERGLMLFIDGDMLISKDTSEKIHLALDREEAFVGVTEELSSTPVYANCQNGMVFDFSFENIAFIDPSRLEYRASYFFEGLQPYLPMPMLSIERLEIDTLEDLEQAETAVLKRGNSYEI